MKTDHRHQTLRHYPALGFLAVAAALALLLPSRLSNPRSDPASLSEFAPVPGDAEGTSDLSDLSEAASAATRSGEAKRSAQGGAAGPASAPSGVARPGNKRCVGAPPRQTEDPLSPPCVAHFDGPNGGATSTGVTAEEIVVVLHWGIAGRGMPTKLVDYATEPAADDKTQDTVGRVYARFFNERFQTYGRRLHLYGYYGRFYDGDPARAYVEDVGEIDDLVQPFAIVPPPIGESSALVREAGRRRIVVAPYQAFERSFYSDLAPHVFSYSPDHEDQSALATEYVCRKLRAKPAKHAPDEMLRGRERVFGLLYSDLPGQPTRARLAVRLRDDLRARCGLHFEREVAIASADQATTAVVSMRTSEVTTVVWLADAAHSAAALNAAGAQAYRPEWFLPRQPGESGDDSQGAQTYPREVWRGAFGISHDYRRGPISEQPWYGAYTEGCTCAPPAGYFAPRTYETMSVLMYGIQAAGPRLSPASIDKGLHSIPQRRSDDPYVPAAYFTHGNYSYVKDAKQIWWDPDGRPPGATLLGCYRMPEDGRRSRASDWTTDDTDHVPSHPCQGPHQP